MAENGGEPRVSGGLQRYWRELRCRKVIRVAVAYAAVGFVVWQTAEIALPALKLPDVAVTFVVAATLLGFPLALVLAWAYEIQPEEPSTAGSPVHEVLGPRSEDEGAIAAAAAE